MKKLPSTSERQQILWNHTLALTRKLLNGLCAKLTVWSPRLLSRIKHDQSVMRSICQTTTSFLVGRRVSASL